MRHRAPVSHRDPITPCSLLSFYGPDSHLVASSGSNYTLYKTPAVPAPVKKVLRVFVFWGDLHLRNTPSSTPSQPPPPTSSPSPPRQRADHSALFLHSFILVNCATEGNHPFSACSVCLSVLLRQGLLSCQAVATTFAHHNQTIPSHQQDLHQVFDRDQDIISNIIVEQRL